ncbi:MAG: hypothetical protein QNJ36_03220 [Calothrix sp. MO_167.B42]|nr:hypothetical protein [Calothrix sp. MO_167.B42]
MWKPLTTVQLSKDWQFSLITQSKCFRFRLTVSQSIVEPLKVDVAQSIFDGSDVDFLGVQTVDFDKAKSIIIPFNTPDFLTDTRVAVKQNTHFYRSPVWLLSVDYYENDN